MYYLKILHSPADFFADSDGRTVWPGFLIMLSLGTVAAGLLVHPFTEQAVESQLARIVSSEEARSAIRTSRRWFYLGLASIPMVLILKWYAYAALLWMLGTLAGIWMDFRKSVEVVAASSTVLLLETYYIALILWLKGRESIEGPLDVQVPIGLNLLFVHSSTAVFTLLGNFNLFEFWFIALLALGVSRRHRCSFSKAAALSVAAWGFSVVFQFQILRYLDRFQLGS